MSNRLSNNALPRCLPGFLPQSFCMEKSDKIITDRNHMNKKKTKEKTRSARIIVILFGILSAAFSSVLFFTAAETLNNKEGYAEPVLIACFGTLFFLISVMISKTGLSSSEWRKPLLITLAASVLTDAIMFPFLGEGIHPVMIVLFVLTLAAAAGIFLLKRDSGNKIPFVLGILGTGTGMLTHNVSAYMNFIKGTFGRLWLGIFFTVLFMSLSLSMLEKAYPPEKKSKAVFAAFCAAAAVQLPALIYSVYADNPTALCIFQGCVLAALISVCAVFYWRSRSLRLNGRGKGNKK